MLTKTEQADFEQNGFVIVENVVSAGDVERLRASAQCEAILAAVGADGFINQHIHLTDITTFHPDFLELARDSRILGRVESLLGPNLALQHSKLTSQPLKAGVGGFPWHQDFAFFQHTNTSLVAVMVYLDDARVENGCMWMVPGSHRLGLLEHRVDGVFTGNCQTAEHFGEHCVKTPIEVRAGGISIHHCLTLHGSQPNQTGAPRRGVVLQYRACDAYQLCGVVWKDTGLVVRGAANDLIRCEAQTVYLSRNSGMTPEYGSAWNQIGTQALLLNG